MSEGYQKQGPKTTGFPGLSSDLKKIFLPQEAVGPVEWSIMKRRARLRAPYAKTEGGRRGGYQPPQKPSPPWGEGVTADAVTDEVFLPHPCPRGVLSCGAEPFWASFG